MAARSRTSEVDEGKDLLRTALGSVLRNRRKRVPKLSQVSLSIQAGLPANAVGDLERGVRTIKQDEVIRLCMGLGVLTETFMAEVSSAQIEALRPLDRKLRGVEDGAAEEKRAEVPDEAQDSSDVVFVSVGIARRGGDLAEIFSSVTQAMKQRFAGRTASAEGEGPREKV